MNTCTTDKCGKPTDLYLCGQCVSDLQQWLDKITETRQMLFTTMAKLDNTGPKNSEGGGGGSTGSAMPLREGAMDLRYALAIWLGHEAKDLARDPHAGGFLEEVKRLIDKAHELVDLPPEEVIDHAAARARLETEVPGPLRPKPLLEYLKLAHGIELKESLLRKWAERKLITRTNPEGYPTYDPATVLIQARKVKA